MHPPGDREPQPESLRTAYQEVCRSHAAITDFRAKLLALLPLATGIGVGAVTLSNKGHVSDIEPGLLVALGIFGAIVTFGLFLYEVRQIDTCKQLRNHGSWLEEQLQIPAGQFTGRRGRLSIRSIYARQVREARERSLGKAEKSGRPEKARAESGKGLLGKPFIGAEAAGYVVYHAVFLAWVAIALFGLLRLFFFSP